MTVFLLGRPVLVSRGATAPKVSGRARNLVPEETRLAVTATAPPEVSASDGTATKSSDPITPLHAVEDRVFALTNQERARQKLPPLQLETGLQRIAFAHSSD